MKEEEKSCAAKVIVTHSSLGTGGRKFPRTGCREREKNTYVCWRCNQKFQTWFSRAAATQTRLRGPSEGMNVVHNLPLSFPFPCQILSRVSTGSIILWKGRGRGEVGALAREGTSSHTPGWKCAILPVLSNAACCSSCQAALTFDVSTEGTSSTTLSNIT